MRDHKLIRLFVKSSFEENALINLDKDQSHYLINVMRRQLSDSILIFNGDSGEYEAKIVSADKSKAVIKVISKTRPQHNPPYLALLYSPVKNVKNEFIVQKATEMGATLIQPVITQNTIKQKTNFERNSVVVIEAAEQCDRLDVPEMREIDKLDKLLNVYKDHNIMLCDETGQGKTLSDTLSQHKKNEKWAILIGPEGGFSKAEIEMLHKMPNIYPVGLGPRILRAETAIITALALWQNYLGDFDSKPAFRT